MTEKAKPMELMTGEIEGTCANVMDIQFSIPYYSYLGTQLTAVATVAELCGEIEDRSRELYAQLSRMLQEDTSTDDSKHITILGGEVHQIPGALIGVKDQLRAEVEHLMIAEIKDLERYIDVGKKYSIMLVNFSNSVESKWDHLYRKLVLKDLVVH